MSQPAAVTDAIRTLVRDHHRPLGPLIDRTATTQRIGRWSYRLFIYAVLLTVFFMVRGFVGSARQGTTTSWEVAVNLANTIFSSQWIGLALQVLWEHPWLIAWFALTLALALWVDDRLDRSYSQFWHEDNMRWKLRKVLGLG